MRVIGFNFDKISIERLKDRTEKLNIKTNIDVSELKPLESDILKTKESLLQAKFSYSVNYEPDYVKVDLRGTAIISIEEKQAKEVMKEWKKGQMPSDFRTFLFNVIMRKASLRSLQLEDELNLPLHLPMPTFRPQKEKEK
jgi:hypothetical protein